jgi:hypothetical protein
VRASGLTFSVRDLRKEWYIPCTVTSNNAKWEKGWFYLRNKGVGLPLHQQGAEGEDRHLARRPISFLVPGSAGVAPQWTEESGRRRARGGFGSCQSTPPADRPPHGEEAPHLRNDRGGRPYSVGTLTAVARAFPSGVRGDEGEVRGNLRTMLTDNDNLWSFIMLPDAPPVSRLPLSFRFHVMY